MNLSEIVDQGAGKIVFQVAPEGTEIASTLMREDTIVLLHITEDQEIVRLEVLLNE